MKRILLAVALLITSLSQAGIITHCLENYQYAYSKQGHDESVLECIKSEIPFLTVDQCLQTAKKLKSDIGQKALLQACVKEQGRQGHFKNCIFLSQTLPTEDQDAAKLYCIEQKYSFTTAKECSEVASTMQAKQLKQKAQKLCL